MEGQKTIAFEIVDQLKGSVPDQILIPIGNGTLITALHAAFVEMKQAKKVKKFPKLIGIQAANCAPLYDAWKNHSLRFSPIKNPQTIAGAIECGDPVYGLEAMMAVKQTNGKILSVSENEMKKAKLSLARKEGLYAEYSGAAVQAVLEKHAWKGITIALLCGHGLKE
jgi:threonine synthase